MDWKKLLITFVCSLLCSSYLRSEIQIETSTLEPVLGETFNLHVNVKTAISEQPEVTFDTDGLQVLSSQATGVQLKSTYENGNLKSERQYTHRYQLRATREGTVYLKSIQAVQGSERYTHNDVAFQVIRERKEVSDYFVLAVPSKTEIYAGEGVHLQYYLYYKKPIRSPQVSEFPKLADFTKRFLQESPGVERVNYQGHVFERILLYSCVIFTDKIGKVVIDPLRINIQYLVGDRRDPFSRFGMGGQYHERKISSELVYLNVKELPASGVPRNFTGLVGKHSFQLDYNRDRLLVNEPLQFTLQVTGGGNLEALSAPQIFYHPDFEEFEKSSELDFSQTSTEGTKTFTYIYLPRKSIDLNASDVEVSFFNPESEKYESVKLAIPEIKVAGGSVSSSQVALTPSASEKAKSTSEHQVKASADVMRNLEMMGPSLATGKTIFSNWKVYVMIVLSLVLFIQLVIVGVNQYWLPRRDRGLMLIGQMLRGQVSYQQYYHFLDQLPNLATHHGATSLRDKISSLPANMLSEKSKSQLLEWLDLFEKSSYGDGLSKKIKLKEKPLREFYRLLKNLSKGNNAK